MDPEKPPINGNANANGNGKGNGNGADKPRDTFLFTTNPNDEKLGVTRRRQSSPTSPGIVVTTSLVPPPPVSTPPVPAVPQYLIHPPTLPKQHVYAPMAPLGALSIGLRKHRKSEEDQFSRLINGKIINIL